MDQKLPVVAKNFWKMVRLAFFMLRKGLSLKSKLMFDLNLLMKRGKFATKAAFQNLMFHSHNTQDHQSSWKEYYDALPAIKHEDFIMMNTAVLKALEMLQSETTSPAFPGFGRTPTVRQDAVDHGDMISHVDEKADEFISHFYRDLRREASAFA
ncbi:unnamed protein product [Withania somnifera]